MLTHHFAEESGRVCGFAWVRWQTQARPSCREAPAWQVCHAAFAASRLPLRIITYSYRAKEWQSPNRRFVPVPDG